MIATKFCTWHYSCAVVACAKICCDLMANNGITASFHRIWIAGKEKSSVKRAPDQLILCYDYKTPSNETCHPGGHFWYLYTNTMLFSRITATHLNIGGTQPSNQLRWIEKDDKVLVYLYQLWPPGWSVLSSHPKSPTGTHWQKFFICKITKIHIFFQYSGLISLMDFLS